VPTIHVEYWIAASPTVVYEMLTSAEYIQVWTQQRATMNPHPGGTFTMFDDEVLGTNVELVAPLRLVQHWRFASWQQDSLVTFMLYAEKGGTRVLLDHEGVPGHDVDMIEGSWIPSYLGILSAYLEANLQTQLPTETGLHELGVFHKRRK